MELNQLQLLIRLQILLEGKITAMLKETTTETRSTETTPLTGNKLSKDMLTYQPITNTPQHMATAKCADKPPSSPQTTPAAMW